jgi:dipeptidase
LEKKEIQIKPGELSVGDQLTGGWKVFHILDDETKRKNAVSDKAERMHGVRRYFDPVTGQLRADESTHIVTKGKYKVGQQFKSGFQVQDIEEATRDEYEAEKLRRPQGLLGAPNEQARAVGPRYYINELVVKANYPREFERRLRNVAGAPAVAVAST